MMHEIHFFCPPDSFRLERLRGILPALRLKTNCDPKNTPPGSICYEYTSGREVELEAAARNLRLTFEWGIGGGTFTCCTAVGDYLYAGSDDLNFYVWLIENPEVPTRAGYTPLNLGAVPVDVAIYRGVAYVISADTIFKINVDDPAAPTLEDSIQIPGESLRKIVVIASIIFAAGNSLNRIGDEWEANEEEVAVESVVEDASVTSASIAIEGRRLFQVGQTDGKLRSFRWGGFYCHAISTGSLAADEVSAELFRGRHISLKGDIVASSIGAGGGPTETDSGVVYASNYVKNGSKFWFQSDTVANPNGVVTATMSSIFSASDGSVWRNTDDATAWTAM